MFSRSDEVNRPHVFESLRVDTSQITVGRDRLYDSRDRPVLPGVDGERTVTGAHGRVLAQRKEPGLNPALIQGTTLWALAAIEGDDSFDIDDSAEEFEDPTRWTSNGGKEKDKVSEAPPNEPNSSGDLEGGSAAGGSGISADAKVIVTPVSSVSYTATAGGGGILKIAR